MTCYFESLNIKPQETAEAMSVENFLDLYGNKLMPGQHELVKHLYENAHNFTIYSMEYNDLKRIVVFRFDRFTELKIEFENQNYENDNTNNSLYSGL